MAIDSKAGSKQVPEDSHTSQEAAQVAEAISVEQWLRLLIIVSTVMVLALAVAGAVKLLSYIGHTLLIFSLGGLVAYALDPIVEMARGKKTGAGPRPSRARTTLIVFAGIFCVVAAIG